MASSAAAARPTRTIVTAIPTHSRRGCQRSVGARIATKRSLAEGISADPGFARGAGCSREARVQVPGQGLPRSADNHAGPASLGEGAEGMDREKLYRLLRLGLEKGASDIHFQVGYLPLYRFNGDLVELRYKVLTDTDTEAIAKLLLADDPRGQAPTMNFDEIDLAFELPNEGRFRVNISRQRR